MFESATRNGWCWAYIANTAKVFTWLRTVPLATSLPTSGSSAPAKTLLAAPVPAGTCCLEKGGATSLVEEAAVYLDEGRSLFGVLTRPARASPDRSSGPSRLLILLNSGAVHRIGPNRLYVEIARACAAKGVPVIRLDLPGLGDSPPMAGTTENVVFQSGTTQQIAKVIEYAKRELGATDISCGGICSGAYNSLKAAAGGLPLANIVVINPLTFFWKEGLALSRNSFRDAAEVMRYRRTALQLSHG